jgi:formylglycine-generating enzyme required for sulfatase activity
MTAHGATWVLIDVSGTPFTMGSPVTELGRDPDEVEHTVTLTRDFWMMTNEITQQQYLDVMGYNPSNFSGCGMVCPVDSVNWHEVAGGRRRRTSTALQAEVTQRPMTAPATACRRKQSGNTRREEETLGRRTRES